MNGSKHFGRLRCSSMDNNEQNGSMINENFSNNNNYRITGQNQIMPVLDNDNNNDSNIVYECENKWKETITYDQLENISRYLVKILGKTILILI